ncbi:MAG: YhfC family glutamic-type intramembrane protease [Pyrodictiaceae archaeon]
MGQLALFIALSLALAPGLLALAVTARLEARLWLNSLLAMAVWAGALAARTPILFLARGMGVQEALVVSALAAGFFEESSRLLLLEYKCRAKNTRCPLAIGLGWGLGEAIATYTPSILVAASLGRVLWPGALAGALERNSAIAFHVSMSLVLGGGVQAGRHKILLLVVAIVVHVLLDYSAGLLFLKGMDIWATEVIVAVESTIALLASMAAYKRIQEDH